MVVRQLELPLERARDGREQVDVDERAREREEDLLDEHPAEHARRFAPGTIAANISSITNVPMLAGRKPFSATPVAYAARICR